MFPYARSYRLALRAAVALAPFASRWSTKLARGLAGRKVSARAFAAWGAAHRDPARPLLLLHGASAGELRQLEPVLRLLRPAHPGWQAVVTCFSPSGLAVAGSLGADVAGLLPWDTAAGVATLLEDLRPNAFVSTAGELWPELTLAAQRRGVRCGLIAATLREQSARRRWPVARLLRPAWAALDAVGAARPDDAERLLAAGVRPAALCVTGDPRYDAVLERIDGTAPHSPEPATLIAGSTWPSDEDLLLPVFRSIRIDRPDARLVIAPHEPSPVHLARLRNAARRVGLPAPVPYRPEDPPSPLRVVEQVGGLAFLYAAGVIAYVGGGFRRTGVHSVLEPAAAGIPVIAGPAARQRAEARELHQTGALALLPERGAAEVLEGWWESWLRDPAGITEAGRRGREVVVRGRGAALRSAELIARLVTGTQQGGHLARPAES